MTYHEVKSLCYREIPFALNMNRGSKEPQPIYITNYDHNCDKCKTLNKAFPNLLHKDFPALVTDKSYLDLFPPERLVSPNPNQDLFITVTMFGLQSCVVYCVLQGYLNEREH